MFFFSGERCPCGAWIAPAFHIQTSKVDLVKPRPPVLMNKSQTSNAVYAGFTQCGAADSMQSHVQSSA